MFKKIKTALSIAMFGALAAQPAWSFTAGQVGPVSLQHGFPVWVMDDAGVIADLSGTAIDAPIDGNDFSQLAGFGAEAFWWGISGDSASGVNIEFAMEAAYLTENPANGDQFPFARIRVNGPVDALGAWTVTVNHPVGGIFTVPITAEDDGQGGIEFKNQGNGDPALGAATDAPPYSGGLPGIDLTHFYLIGGNAAPDVTITGPGTGTPVNIPAAAFALVFGRVMPNFTVGLPLNNTAPFAMADSFAVAAGATKVLPILANDTDVISAGVNDFTINPKAVGIVLPGARTNPATPYEIGVESVATTLGGSVKKNADGTITYTAPSTFGEDTFEYVVQDDAGCISGTLDCSVVTDVGAPVTVTVAVQEITVSKAVFQPKFMKWDIKGRVAGGGNSTANIYAGATTAAPLIGTVTTNVNGDFSFTSKSAASPGNSGIITVESAALVTNTANIVVR